MSDQQYQRVYAPVSPPVAGGSQYSPEVLAEKEKEASDDAKQALTMSLLGLVLVCVGFILAVIAFRKASSAIQTMDEYGVAQEKRGMAQAAKVISIIDVVVWLTVIGVQIALR